MFIHGKGVFGTRPGEEGEPRENRATLSCRPRLSKPTKVKALPPRPFTREGGETCIRKKVGGTLETV